MFSTWAFGLGLASPAAHAYLRGSGKSGVLGWFGSERMEALRSDWLSATDADKQAAICRDMQLLAFQEVPYYPTGVFYQPTAHKAELVDLVGGGPVFWGVRRA
jgi:peptide/nickel transport system substrate-binding protein